MTGRVTVLAVSGQHSFFGVTENRGVRVLDLLNDSSTEYLQLHDVTVRRGIQGDCIKQLRQATIPKVAVDFVLLEPDKHEAPVRRAHCLVDKEPRNSFLLLGDYEVQGTFMAKGSFDPILALRQDPSDFFPVKCPTLRQVTGTGPGISAGAALINCRKLSLLYVERQVVRSMQ